MATYNNQHWLLSHIRNSFISTDDTGMCETVMLSEDLPKQLIQRYQQQQQQQQPKKFDGLTQQTRPPDTRIHSITPTTTTTSNNDDNNIIIDTTTINNDILLCYPGLDQSDDEDIDLATQSYDIQMYPEIGSHRFRSNTAQKLEKMDIARRKASRIRNIKVDDSFVIYNNELSTTITNNLTDLFERKNLDIKTNNKLNDNNNDDKIISRLSEQLILCPKQPQNKFLQYAKFDGTSQTGIQTKTLHIFLNMLPETQRNYPMKICVISQAKIEEVIGFICYKFTIHNPNIPLQSVRHYGLFITEDNGEMFTEFPPLDLRQPCQKFEFNYLTLAERRPAALSITSEGESLRDEAVKDFRGSSSGCGGISSTSQQNTQQSDDMERMLGHNSMIEAPLYRTYRLQIKGFLKTDVQLGISGERLEIDPVAPKNSKFWNRQKAISYNIESIAYCEIIEQKSIKSIIRIWYLNPYPINSTTSSSSMHFHPDIQLFPKGHPFSHQIGGGIITSSGSNLLSSTNVGGGGSTTSQSLSSSSSSPQHFNTNININNSSSTIVTNSFKYYDFETDKNTAQEILNKMNFILDVRSSATRKEFLMYREKKKERMSKKTVYKN